MMRLLFTTIATIFYFSVSAQCVIELKDIEFGSCTDNQFSITFNMDRENTPSDSFRLFSNDIALGVFAYADLPLTFEEFPSSGTATERLTVCDSQDSECCDDFAFESNCGCGFDKITTRVVDCNEETGDFYVLLDFEPRMTSDSFILGGNMTSYGTYAYVDLPVLVGPLALSETTDYELVIVDRFSAFCFDAGEVGIIANCNGTECEVAGLTLDASECNEDGTFNLVFSFEHNSSVSDSFMARGNGANYGTFAYGESPYTIPNLPGDGSTIYELVVIDKEDENCKTDAFIPEPISCVNSCILTFTEADIICNDNVVRVFLGTETDGIDSVSIFLNEELITSARSDEFPYLIPDGKSYSFPLLVQVKLKSDESCLVSYTIEEGCIDCDIDIKSIELIGCNSRGEGLFEINAEFQDVISANVIARLNGERFSSFNREDFPVTTAPLEFSSDTLVFTLTDADSNCTGEFILTEISCPSSINDLERLDISIHNLQDILVINDPNQKVKNTKLSDLAGNQVLITRSNRIDLESLNTGIYIVSLQTEEGLLSKKIFIR